MLIFIHIQERQKWGKLENEVNTLKQKHQNEKFHFKHLLQKEKAKTEEIKEELQQEKENTEKLIEKARDIVMGQKQELIRLQEESRLMHEQFAEKENILQANLATAEEEFAKLRKKYTESCDESQMYQEELKQCMGFLSGMKSLHNERTTKRRSLTHEAEIQAYQNRLRQLENDVADLTSEKEIANSIIEQQKKQISLIGDKLRDKESKKLSPKRSPVSTDLSGSVLRRQLVESDANNKALKVELEEAKTRYVNDSKLSNEQI